MKRKRYSEEQILSILKEHQAGGSFTDLARRCGPVNLQFDAGRMVRLLVDGCPG